MNWYYVDTAGQQAGPVDEAGLDALLASGQINGETLIWKEGMANWQPAREIRPSALGAQAPIATGVEEAVCAECGGIFPINDTIRIGNARVCANCKPVFVQKMQEGVNVDAPGTYHYAGFWIRWVAAFVDGLILGAVNVVISMVSVGATATLGGNKGAALGLVQIVLMMLQFGIAITYHTFFIGKYGSTPGKMAVRVRVIMADGSPMTYGRAFGRHFAKIINYFTCLIGYIMAGFDDEKRALHDRICATRVVYK